MSDEGKNAGEICWLWKQQFMFKYSIILRCATDDEN